MRLSTQIKDSKNKKVNYAVSTSSYATMYGMRTHVSVSVESQEVGSMLFSIAKDCLHIHRMANHTIKGEKPLKYVGSLLIEYAFNKSLKAGKGGRIELEAINKSPAFYFKVGLRKKTMNVLSDLIFEYANNNEKKFEIMHHRFYKFLLDAAAQNLKKQTSQVTFEEAIEHGLYSPANHQFEAILREKVYLSSVDCFAANMQGTMYFPSTVIEEKKAEYSRFIPVGSNYFFSQSHALKALKNPRLKDLVSSGKLDSSNAIEIEGKMNANDPRLEFLLTPLGLKMMKRNYISGWYIGVYFHSIESVKAIISANGLIAFQKGFINIKQLINISEQMRIFLLSDIGLKKLENKELVISETGYSVCNKDGERLNYEQCIERVNLTEQSRLQLHPK